MSIFPQLNVYDFCYSIYQKNYILCVFINIAITRSYPFSCFALFIIITIITITFIYVIDIFTHKNDTLKQTLTIARPTTNTNTNNNYS